MRSTLYLSIMALAILFFSCNNQENASATLHPTGAYKKANPFVGTGGHGHTFPGATLPFGMMQLSPDTRLDGWDGCGGYHYSDSLLYGFSHTHLSGTGCSDYGDILLLPVTGDLRIGLNDMPVSGFSHDNEEALPGYYRVHLNDYDIEAELTTSLRSGMHKYTFHNANDARIILDLKHRDLVSDALIEKVSDTKIRGYRHSTNWASDQMLFFVMEFSKPIAKSEDAPSYELTSKDGKKTQTVLKTTLHFDVNEGEEILVKVGISAVDMDGAQKNLDAEISDWDFKKTKQEAFKTWDLQLSKIEIEGGSEEQQRTFYSAMYHSFIAPNLYSDVDGRYRGRDLKVHQSDHDYYTVFSLWDTYRTTHPLFTILEEKRTVDFINTFIKQWEQGGLLPVWELSACETNCMIGNHAIPVIADAILKGLDGFDIDKAYKAMVTSVEQDKHEFKVYRELGFIPSNEGGSSVSVTLEYAFDDWCIAMIAKHLNKDEDYKKYIQRAQSYKNLLDPETNCMRPRINGGWKVPFDPTEVDFNYTEANSWQYSFYAPQDVMGLAKLMGGEVAFEKQLDTLFTMSTEMEGRHQADITGMIGQYAHGNEPSHHMAYLYNYIGKAWKTQYYVDRICNEMYTDQPDGYIGNEDCGQMSAWYVMSAMGFYPVAPSGQDYVIGTPLFPKMKVHLENGNTLEIIAEGRSDKNMYIQSLKWNGKEYSKSVIQHKDIMQGGKLEFVMGPKPNKDWASQPENRPVSEIKDHLIVTAPWVNDAVFSFEGQKQIEVLHRNPNAKLLVSDDQNNNFEYSEPIIVKDNIKYTLKAIVEEKSSAIFVAEYHKVPKGRKIQIKYPYSTIYTGGGENGLIDLQRGGRSFSDGTWQAYQKNDLDVTISLDNAETIHKVTIGTMQDINSWIWMPTWIDVYTSMDGSTFTKVGRIENDVDIQKEGMIVKDNILEITPTKAKYIRVHAKNFGKCPPWHKGYELQGDGWIFADEILLN